MRVWLKRLLLALLLLAGVYLLAANLFLNTPAASRAFNRRPERFRIEWSAAWSVWPGLVHARGLQLSGNTRNVSWSIAADRVSGWIALPPLLGREVLFSHVRGEGVRASVLRGAGVGTPAAPPGARPRKRRPWTFRFEGVVLDPVREFRFNAFRLAGDGRAEGSFRFAPGGELRLEPSRARMPAARLALGDGTFAREVELKAEASLGPYAPRRHPGLAGFDFLTGSLQARGRVSELPFLDKSVLPPAGRGRPGALAADLRVERGRFAEGSRFEITAPSSPAAAPASPFVLTAVVGRGPLLRLGIEAQGLAAGRRRGAPPVFRSASLSAASTTSETRLSRIFATARDLKARRFPTPLPLMADVRAAAVRIEAPGSRATLRATVDRAAGRIGLAGLLGRAIAIDGLQADGVSARLDLARSPAPPGARAPVSVRIAGARLTGIRELALGDFHLAGEARADATFSYEPDGTLTVERAALVLPSGRFQANGEPAAQGLSLRVEARIEPSILGQSRGLAFLRHVSGTADLRARISSLGFLRPYFQKVPWLSLEGQGGLTADVRMDHGRLNPGTRLAVSASPVRATLLDSLATGRGTVTAAVEEGKSGPLTALRVRFDRFGLADLRREGRPAYIQGRGLRITAVTPSALDLTAPVPDFDATLDLPDAEVPDLAVYDALLPEGSGISILSGRGRARLHLAASTATRKTRGEAVLTSDAARFRFQNLELEGRLALRAPLVSPDLESRRFDLKGTRLALDGVSFRDLEEEGAGESPGWWMRAELSGGSLLWGAPLSLRGEGRIDMKNSGPILTLFAQRSRFLKWFDDALNVENVTARGVVRLGDGAVQVESLQASGGPLELRTRMTFSRTRRLGDLYVRYGRLAAGVELRDGQRTVKLRRPLEWYESRREAGASP